MEKKSVKRVSIMEQARLFGLESLAGFLRINLIGLGRRLGIFDYLNKKAKSNPSRERFKAISFSLDELLESLDLNERYLEAWLNAAIEVGIFEINDREIKTIKTAPYVFDLLIDSKSPFFFGDAYGSIYRIALLQEEIFNNFKSGDLIARNEVPESIIMDGHRTTSRMALKLEKYFSKHFPDHQKRLIEGGFILEVGCGYGFNLENWAKKYVNSKFIAIDIDERAIEFANNRILKKNWGDRIEILNVNLINYEPKESEDKFDLIILNQVIHEMDTSQEHRKKAFIILNNLLKKNGLLLVVESIVSELFDSNRKPEFIEALHKWQEVCFTTRFYSEEDFNELIRETPFQDAELIREEDFYFWVIKKN